MTTVRDYNNSIRDILAEMNAPTNLEYTVPHPTKEGGTLSYICSNPSMKGLPTKEELAKHVMTRPDKILGFNAHYGKINTGWDSKSGRNPETN